MECHLLCMYCECKNTNTLESGCLLIWLLIVFSDVWYYGCQLPSGVAFSLLTLRPQKVVWELIQTLLLSTTVVFCTHSILVRTIVILPTTSLLTMYDLDLSA